MKNEVPRVGRRRGCSHSCNDCKRVTYASEASGSWRECYILSPGCCCLGYPYCWEVTSSVLLREVVEDAVGLSTNKDTHPQRFWFLVRYACIQDFRVFFFF